LMASSLRPECLALSRDGDRQTTISVGKPQPRRAERGGCSSIPLGRAEIRGALGDCFNHKAQFTDQGWLDPNLYDIETARPLLDYPFAADIKEKRWFLDLVNDVTERTRYRLPTLCWMFHFYPEPAGRLEGRISGVYLRDATRRTDFRLAYLPTENKAILRFNGRFYEYTLKRTGRLQRRRLQD